MANNLVEIMIEVEKTVFIDVMRALNNTPGIAKINWDLSMLKGRRAIGNKNVSREGEGGEHRSSKKKPASAEDMQQHILIAMRDGTIIDKAALLKVLKRAGYTGAGLNPALKKLIDKHLVERVQRGHFRLEAKALEHLNNHAGALPAPAPETNGEAEPSQEPNGKIKSASGLTSQQLIIAFMQNQGRPVGRKEVMAVLNNNGLSPAGADALLHKMRTENLSKFGPSAGTYELTAKGKRFGIEQASE